MMSNIELASYYRQVRSQTEQLCAPLEIEDHVVQPIADVSPPKWHLAHTTWFFENFILAKHQKNYQAFNEQFFYLFNSYYEHEGARWQQVDRGNLTRPAVKEIYSYRTAIDERMQNFIQALDQEKDKQLIEVIILGLHHEQQHQELLLTDFKYILCHNPLRPVYNLNPLSFDQYNSSKNTNSDIVINAGVYKIGFSGEGFCFDNEKPVHKQYINPVEISSNLVTNEEYINFIEDDGYKNFRHWLMEGWEWIKATHIQHPLYWQQEGKEWYEMTLNGYQKVDLLAPVTHISYYEAEAYAVWAGKRLPTEYEWEVAANSLEIDKDACNFQETGIFHPVAQRNQLAQFLGNVWVWTNSAYLPYYGYKQPKGALGEYNGKFMVNQMVLKGGSCATPKNHVRKTYRNFFHADKRWQFSGIRLAENI